MEAAVYAASRPMHPCCAVAVDPRGRPADPEGLRRDQLIIVTPDLRPSTGLAGG